MNDELQEKIDEFFKEALIDIKHPAHLHEFCDTVQRQAQSVRQGCIESTTDIHIEETWIFPYPESE